MGSAATAERSGCSWWWYTVLKRKSRAAGREPTAAEFWKKQRSF